MSDLGKAYVQIIPSAEGIKGMIEKELGGESEIAGKKSGGKFISAFKTILVTAGIGKVFKDAIMGGGALEQSIGGIETLFKGSADKMKVYADEAYMTAGVSANRYMEMTTSFAASLLQSVSGDTNRAADIANMAMIDMSDNANKMGTNMIDIQNAYQGFAKQNYTMLDNLKLGYGGTKTEMERLLADAEKLTGIKYDISNLSDVYQAIHVIQEELGITGTTAIEAADTLQGSFASMYASFQNLMAKMALGMDVGPALKAMGTTILTFVKNLFPMIANLVLQLPQSLIEVLKQSIPGLLQAGTDMVLNIVVGLIEGIPFLVEGSIEIIKGLINGLLDGIPKIIEAGVKLLTSLIENLPQIITTIVAALPLIIDSVIKGLLENIPLIIDAGVKLLTALIENLPLIILTIVSALPEIIISIVESLVSNTPLIVDTGVKLLTALITNLPQIIWTLIKSMPQIIISMVNALAQGIGEFIRMGGQLISGLWQGIKDKAGWLWNQIKGFFGQIVNRIKNFFGISSPSKLFAEFGANLDAGLAKGISDNKRPITQAMDEVGRLTARTFESDIAFNAISPGRLDSLAASVELNAAENNAGRPAYLTFNLAGHKFKAFVDDITKIQDRTIELELAY
ncbi:MAG: phage tail protein [Eubacteriales bacterium]